MNVFYSRYIKVLIIILFYLPAEVYAQDYIKPFSVTSEKAVVDQNGRRILVEKKFSRIISLYGAHTENLFALGLNKEIIGVSRHEVFPPEAMKKAVFSYHDDPEKFLAVNPDLVLIRPMIDRGYPNLVARLEKSGITIASLQPGTVGDMFKYWTALGILTGKLEESLEMISGFKESVSVFKSLTKTVGRKKRVYFEAIHNKMKTFSPNSMAIFALETAGGINIAIDAKSVRGTNIAAYGKERILSHAAEIDVYLVQYGAMNRPTLSLIKNETGFRLIKAVKDDQVYIIDEIIVSRPTLRLLNGIQKIGKILYPDVFSEDALSFP